MKKRTLLSTMTAFVTAMSCLIGSVTVTTASAASSDITYNSHALKSQLKTELELRFYDAFSAMRESGEFLSGTARHAVNVDPQIIEDYRCGDAALMYKTYNHDII